MNDRQLLRYSRHILLDDIGIEGQERLLAAHALILGAGGLASPAALYLASAGVGRITLIDDDTVDLTNLQRQIMHTEARVGEAKVQSARAAMHAINPDIRIDVVQGRADEVLLRDRLADADVALDCTDNFAARHALNRACVALRKPLVSGAAIGFDGQVSVYDPRDAQSPCYACVFPDSQAVEEVRCSTMGVFAPIVGVVGSLQAVEALKLLCGIHPSLAGRLILIDSRRTEFTTIQLQRDRQCRVCGNGVSL